MKRIPLSLIVAITADYGIGRNGGLPWSEFSINLTKDLQYFREVSSNPAYPDPFPRKDTTNFPFNAVLMGRKTWESIPLHYRPLKGRMNIIISNSLSSKEKTCETSQELIENIHIFPSFQAAVKFVSNHPICVAELQRIIAIGGAQLFEEALFHEWCDRIHITQIKSPYFSSDTYLTPKTISFLQQLTTSPVSLSFQERILHHQINENGVNYSITEYLKHL